VAIAQAGGIGPLIALLGDGTPAGREAAAATLRNLATNNDNQLTIAKMGGISPLIALLGNGTPGGREQAAAALKNLAADNVENKVAIAQGGGLPQLIALLGHGTAAGREQAAWALRNLASYGDNKVAIARAGGIDPLIALLSDGTPAGREAAAWALKNLASDGDNKVAIAQAGGIGPLIALLGDGTPAGREAAAATLRNLATNNDNQLTIAKMGGISPLIALLGNGTPGGREQAAAALKNLAANNVENKVAIAQAGGIAPLIALKRSGTPGGKKQSTAALLLLEKYTDMSAGAHVDVCKGAEQGTGRDSRLVVAAPPTGEPEAKFQVQNLILGHADEAALGLNAALGIDEEDELPELLALKEKAIIMEFQRHGSAEDKANLNYILACQARQEPLPEHIRQQIESGKYHGGAIAGEDFDVGHDGMRFDDFVNHEHSRLARLGRAHVLALRLYTSTSYPCFNKHLRQRTQPHPFKMSVYYLSDGVKKLRSVAAKTDKDFAKEVSLWRGMQNMALADDFRHNGGTELAPMSTSHSKSVAAKYAMSATPLIFHFRARALGKGVSIGFLSLYPKEEEYLYPPLTYLSYVGDEEDGGFNIVEVQPMMP